MNNGPNKPQHLMPPTPICAIGASAGGLTPLQNFFASIKDDLGLAFVVIVHLAPDYPSRLAEILSARTTMPVLQVESTARLTPNSVYVIPPDRELVIHGDDLEARPFSDPRGRRMPIDLFFRSVAQARGDGIAIVMSGSGSDGAIGLRAVKEAGGVTFVQEPSEAQYEMMPAAAIGTGAADFIEPIARIAAGVAEVTQSKRALRAVDDEEAESIMARILGVLRSRTGHDFSSYKSSTVMRRIMRRMQVARQHSLASYYKYLQENSEEAQQLLSDLLISVTMFFRDRQAFSALKQKVLERIFAETPADGTIRVWVAGCATGEEAYSIGMLLLEEAEQRHIFPSIQIFASDLDEAALAIAREGRYPKAIEADVTEERIRRFFIEDGACYRVKKELRELVLFAAHSALKDPPFNKLDLISCRNLLIYLKRDLQLQLCNLFHYALNPGGYLFLGSAETADLTPSLFHTLDREARIYEARVLGDRAPPPLPQLSSDRHCKEHQPKALLSDEPVGAGQTHISALEHLAPPNVLIDSMQRVLHLSPNASRFFLASGGAFSPDLAEQVRPELRVDLKLALQRALEKAQATLTLPIPVAFNGTRRLTALHVLPWGPKDGGLANHALVFFIDSGEEQGAGNSVEDEVRGEDLRFLRQELAASHDRLTASRLAYDRATQDLRAANEELQSMNEEYRSTAEELETSKEELQSMNEELQTVNSDLKNKLDTISSAHNDLMNLMATTEIGTLFLDNELKIKLFTPPVTKIFSIEQTDIGRPIASFTNRLLQDGLEDDARQVLSSLLPSEAELQTRDGQWYSMSLRPYRTTENRIEGVVVTFADVTARKLAEDALAGELRAMMRLRQLSIKVVEAGQLEAPLLTILDAAIELVRADFGNIQLYDKDTETLRFAVQRGFEERFLNHHQKVDVSEGSGCGLDLAAGNRVLIEDVEKEPAFAASLEEAKAAGFRAVASVPLYTSAGSLVGRLSVHFRSPRHFNDFDLRLIDICARQGADAINAFLLQQSVRDNERRLRKVLETDAVAVLFFNDEGVLIDSNEAFLSMSGYTRQEIEGGELTRHKLTPPEWLGETEKQFKLMEVSGRIGPYEKEYLRKDGSRRWMVFAGRRIERNLIAEFGIDISDRKRAEEERELLGRELAHRVKNTLAVVKALAVQTTGGSIEEFQKAFVGRLEALAATHDLLLGANWKDANVKVVITNALKVYGVEISKRVDSNGPAMMVTARQALGLSTVLHELGTNALKYGSLSTPNGRVNLAWHNEEAPTTRMLHVIWRERGGPPAKPPKQKGFGMQLIERVTGLELEGEVNLTFGAEGLDCELAFPL